MVMRTLLASACTVFKETGTEPQWPCCPDQTALDRKANEAARHGTASWLCAEWLQ